MIVKEKPKFKCFYGKKGYHLQRGLYILMCEKKKLSLDNLLWDIEHYRIEYSEHGDKEYHQMTNKHKRDVLSFISDNFDHFLKYISNRNKGVTFKKKEVKL